MTTRSVIFAGGGTGGHIFPALAIAEALRATTPGVRTTMVGADRELDRALLTTAVDRGDLDAFFQIPAQPFGVRPKAAWRLLNSWGRCVRETRILIRNERERTGAPPIVVAMGGYVSAAPVRAAMTEQCPVILVNLDAVPGKANRWIAQRATNRLTVGQSSDVFEPLDATPLRPIVRASIHDRPQPEDARARFGLDPARRTLLVTGGSQGARTVNAFVTKYADDHAGVFNDHAWQILHQSGSEDAEAVEAIYRAAGIPARVLPFIDDIAAAWAAASASVCRAGAGTVAEAWATRTPSLFLPYPYHRDQHQRINAAWLTGAGAGLLGEDKIDTDANIVHNGPLLSEFLRGTPTYLSTCDMLTRMGPADGAELAAQIVADAMTIL